LKYLFVFDHKKAIAFVSAGSVKGAIDPAVANDIEAIALVCTGRIERLKYPRFLGISWQCKEENNQCHEFA